MVPWRRPCAGSWGERERSGREGGAGQGPGGRADPTPRRHVARRAAEPLRTPARPRRGGHGPGPPGPGHAARSPRRPQDRPGRPAGGPRFPRPSAPGDPAHARSAPSFGGDPPRRIRVGRGRAPRHGARRWPSPDRAPRGGALSAAHPEPRARRGRWPRLRPRAGDHPSRPEAGQPHGGSLGGTCASSTWGWPGTWTRSGAPP